MSKNDSVAAMYTRMPMVAALNKVPGFDPMKLLRRTVSSKTGEEVFKLDLQYKKLWFRLAHPEGRIKLKPLRITEQLAIYEAQVYLSREDDEPVSNFTSSILRTEAPNGQYVQAAQEEAVDKALTDAGFGIQLSDVSVPESKRHFGCEVPIQAMNQVADVIKNAPKQQPEVKQPVQRPAVAEKPPVKRVDIPVQQRVEQPPMVKTAVPTAPQSAAHQQDKVIDAVPAKEPVRQPDTAPVVQPPAQEVKKNGADQALEILRRRNATVSQNPNPAQAVTTTATSYTKDMPVEEIVKLMTLEQAKAVVVDAGTCRGKTMEEVAARRIASVKFYLTAGYTSDNNIVRAAARIMLDHVSMQKAS